MLGGQTNSPCSSAAQLCWVRQLHQTQREVEENSLVSHLPAINLLPKIAAEPWGVFIAATQAFSALKEALARVSTDAVLPEFGDSVEQ